MFDTFAILDLSTPDLLIILAIVLLLFGSRKLPELAKSLGSSARELKAGLKEASTASQELKQQVAEVAAVPQPAFADVSQPTDPYQTMSAPVNPVQQRPSQYVGQNQRPLR